MSEGLVLAGRYRLTRKLGQGGMGSVWRAEDLNLGAEVAIKLIDPALASSNDALMRFKREAQAAASIRSTYVVQILDHGIDDGMPFIAMELLNGESLAQRLESVGKLSADQTGRLLGHVGRALSLAHENGIVHRDMKPENVFLVREDDDEVGKVLDFGIARQGGGLSDVGGLKTQTGAILGTPYYMSPEQATGQPVDHLTDVWAFGLIACECLTGRRCFEGESLGGLFHAICMAPMPVPSQLGGVPLGFDEWFARTAARDKLQRYPTIKEAAAELRALCRRASGSLSASLRSSGNGSAANAAVKFASTTGADVARPVGAAVLQTTDVVSAQSILGLTQTPRKKRTGRMLAAVGAFGLVGVVGVLGVWRLVNRVEPLEASTPAASASTSAVAFSGAASVAAVAPPAAPMRIEPVDAGPQPATTGDRPAITVPPAFAPRPRAAPIAATPPAKAKDPPPPANPRRTPIAPHRRDDNAAGI